MYMTVLNCFAESKGCLFIIKNLRIREYLFSLPFFTYQELDRI